MTVGAKYLLFIYAGHGGMQVDYCGNSGLVRARRKELRQVERLIPKHRATVVSHNPVFVPHTANGQWIPKYKLRQRSAGSVLECAWA
jgi:hypothetical protein